jgi:hypothetical protein
MTQSQGGVSVICDIKAYECTRVVVERHGGRRMWNIMLPWNRVLTSSTSIFQTSREHVLVVLTVCVWRANRI